MTSTYLTLQSLHKHKACLKNMFTCEKWRESVWAKVKAVSKISSMPSFWYNVVWTLKVMGPIIRVLRLAKNEKKPAMGYIYKAMDTAKEAIRLAFDKDDDCKVVFDIIDKRWDCQLNNPLHAAGYYFIYCTTPDIEKDKEVMKGVMKCVKRLVPSQAKQDLIMMELIKWVDQAGCFSDDLAVRAHGKIAPGKLSNFEICYTLYKPIGGSYTGKEIPDVQELAIKVLSLTCSSSWCDRNWSLIDYVNSDKWNQLEHEKLEDLVFVRYNRAFKHRWNKDVVCDPISLEDIDYSNKWLIGQIEEQYDDSMSDEVAYASLEDEDEADEEEITFSNDLEDEYLLAWFAARDEEDVEDDFI
ncbi:uncharacterized protein LOC143601960 [Bidens hawaiensis]|uniref:uncharacterized protein LOC143601960 n=1 Tax=Bidens hawaiensis TaxID=980011 RepID=UPI00404A1084